MARSDKDSITWGDLKEDALQTIFNKWVRKVIRRCFFTFFPVFVIIAGAFISVLIFYFEDIRFNIKHISVSVNNISNLQSGMKEQISSNKEQIQWLRKENK